MNEENHEQEFLNTYNKEQYEKPSVTVDLLIFTIEDDELKIVLIRRNEMPYKDSLALPGVFVRIDETLEEAAYRTIKEEIGSCDIYLEQLFTWGDIERDPRMRIISISYMAIVSPHKLKLVKGERVSEVKLYSVNKLIDTKEKLAFDHMKMIKYAIERIKNKVAYTKIAFEFVEEEFTLPQLQKVYEILLNKTLYKANFRNKIKELVEETDKMTEKQPHRPSKYYRLRETEYEQNKGIFKR
ncbi:NUDIX hydrolase [Vallitalea guaymasensis]|nr:NUDIX domain-containing protein [Vallitalea guaymasensis]